MSNDMSTARMEELLKESEEALEVFTDLVLEDGTKVRAGQSIQMLLLHAKKALLKAKDIAKPHRIPISFLGITLRYPEDCDAGYMVDDNEIEKMKNHPDKSMQDYGKRLEAQKPNIEPKFLGDAIWDSSENCSDQGLYIFEAYDDFAMNSRDKDGY